MPRRKKIDLEGSGIFSDAWNIFKKAGTVVAQKIIVPKIAQYATPIAKATRYLTNLVVPKGYKPSIRKWLEANGRGVITSVRVRRVPVGKAINTAFSLITAGKWDESKKAHGYDNFFHLSLLVKYELDGVGKTAIFEKNDTLNFTNTLDNYPNAEFIEVAVPYHLTIMEAVNNTQKVMGEKYFKYSAFNNNCQSFVGNFLRANNLQSDATEDFVYQSVKDLIMEQPAYTEDFAQTLTNLGGIADRVREGYGKANHHTMKPVMIGGRKMVSLQVE